VEMEAEDSGCLRRRRGAVYPPKTVRHAVASTLVTGDLQEHATLLRGLAVAAARLLVSCRSCRRSVALVPRLDDAALGVLVNHLRCLHRDGEPGKLPKEVMQHFKVIPAEAPWFRHRLREALR